MPLPPMPGIPGLPNMPQMVPPPSISHPNRPPQPTMQTVVSSSTPSTTSLTNTTNSTPLLSAVGNDSEKVSNSCFFASMIRFEKFYFSIWEILLLRRALGTVGNAATLEFESRHQSNDLYLNTCSFFRIILARNFRDSTSWIPTIMKNLYQCWNVSCPLRLANLLVRVILMVPIGPGGASI